MDIVYYLSGALMTIVIILLLIATIASLVKPNLLNNRKIVKKPFSRLKIVAVALIALTITLVGFGSVLGATEPESVKQARLTAEAERKSAELDKVHVTPKATPAPVKVEKQEAKVEVIPFETTEEQSNTLPKGQTQITTEGVNGEKTFYYIVTYVDGKELSRELKSESITKEPVKKVIAVGTYVAPAPAPKPAQSSASANACNSNYSGCVPNVSYDLNCKQIGQKVRVLGYDQYRLDGDGDGWGCDSY